MTRTHDHRSTPVDQTAFDAAIAGWFETLHCEATRKQGGSCRRPAHWLLNLHGCERVLLCGQHVRAWQRDAHATMGPFCDQCGGAWATLVDAYSVTPL